MDVLRADRVSLLLARQLSGAIRAYYTQIDQSTEDQVPASRVMKIEQLEPLGLAVQMYCLFLRALECDQTGADRIAASGWKTLELTPEIRDDVVTEARGLFDQMRRYPAFRANAAVEEMVAERCQAIVASMEQAPELQAYVRALSACSDRLRQFVIA
jgi:hypothetical protein